MGIDYNFCIKVYMFHGFRNGLEKRELSLKVPTVNWNVTSREKLRGIEKKDFERMFTIFSLVFFFQRGKIIFVSLSPFISSARTKARSITDSFHGIWIWHRHSLYFCFRFATIEIFSWPRYNGVVWNSCIDRVAAQINIERDSLRGSWMWD